MSLTDEPEDHKVLLSDGSTVWLRAVPLRDGLAGAEPEEIVLRVTDAQAIVIGVPSETKHPRWGQWVAVLTASEWRSLLQTLDSATRTFIESQRWTGALVELDPTSRAMWKSGLFKVVTEEGGWMQANLREGGQFARVMRIRPATGLAAMAGPVAILGAIAAQAQAAEMARENRAIRQQVDNIRMDLQSGQVGAVENAVKQVEDLVDLLRVHGKLGASESDVSVIRNSLGDARYKCKNHLKDAVARLEIAKEQGSPRQVEKSLSNEAVEEVLLYLDLLGKLYAATVQFGFAQVALDYHAGRPDVAEDRSERTTRSIAEFRAEFGDIMSRLDQLDQSVHAQFLPWWKHAIKQIPASALTVAGIGAIAPAVAALRVGLEGDSGNDDGTAVEPAGDKNQVLATAVGGVVGVGYGGFNVMAEGRAQKTLDERLGRLTAASSRSSETMDQVAPSLEILRTLTAEIAELGE